MGSLKIFNTKELEAVDNAVCLAEELVSNYYKMSSTQWLRSRYDVKTAKVLRPEERVQGPFAQVVGYEGRAKDVSLSSSTFDYYTICLQDKAILDAVETKPGLELFPFLVYVVSHELVHIVRFARFQQIYKVPSSKEEAMDEERRVHDLTWKILKPVCVPGLDKVLAYYVKWRCDAAFDTVI